MDRITVVVNPTEGGVHLQESPPSQIVSEISGGHAVEPFHPFLQSAVGGVDVLDVEDVLEHPFP